MREEKDVGGTTIDVRCCIAGGGPAGMMLGFLLARAGVDVLVLEKHADFLRDFRGDTVHPSTLEVMHELGLLTEFLKRPHQEVRQLTGYISGVPVRVADFTHLRTHCRYIALMPQWDFLNFLAEHGRQFANFHLKLQARVTELIEEGNRVVGLKAETPEGPLKVRSTLVVGCDGRHSTVRERAGFKVVNVGAPIDVLWLRLSRRPDDPEPSAGWFDRGRILVMINRGDYWQCGFIIAKGEFANIRNRGLDAFRADIAAIAPFVGDRAHELRDWDDIKLLTVVVDHLRKWHRPGLLCIGDAAHAMSPVGGVGINLAIQDAVATANLLAEPLRAGRVTNSDLAHVQRRRTLPTWLTQRLQVFVQDRVLSRVLKSRKQLALPLPLPLRLFRVLPILTRIPARLVGIGIRPEHVRTPTVGQTREAQRV